MNGSEYGIGINQDAQLLKTYHVCQSNITFLTLTKTKLFFFNHGRAQLSSTLFMTNVTVTTNLMNGRVLHNRAWLQALGISELLKMTHHIRYASILNNLVETISQETYHRRESSVDHQVTLHANHIQPHSAPRRSKIPALQWTHA